MQIPLKFNIRVYGLWIKNGALLCCHESYLDKHFVKFPGGGLEFGEGILDCLYREFREETQTVPEQCSLYYVNDFYQQSAFDPADQLVSIYYKVNSEAELTETTLVENRNGNPWKIELFWVPVSELKPENMTFPVDREVVARLIAEIT